MDNFSKKKPDNQLLISNFSEKEYEQVENIFVNNTNHIETLVQFVEKKILSKISLKNNFLDIGAGPGYITKKIAKFFNSTTIVEPNQAYLSKYINYNFFVHTANFQDIKILKLYDFVLCSHVLYHIYRWEWPIFLKKIYNSIQIGGKAVIVFIAPRGSWHDFRYSIKTNYLDSSEVSKVLSELKIPFEIVVSQSIFKTINYEDFYKLIFLFTIDDCFTQKQYKNLSKYKKKSLQEKIKKFIEECKDSDGYYILTCEEDYFVLNK